MLKRLIKEVLESFFRWIDKDDRKDREPGDLSAFGVPSKNANLVPQSKQYLNISDLNSGLNLTVYSATGGKVIQVHTYDQNQGTHRASLYVITDQEELGEELAQIITRESLTR